MISAAQEYKKKKEKEKEETERKKESKRNTSFFLPSHPNHHTQHTPHKHPPSPSLHAPFLSPPVNNCKIQGLFRTETLNGRMAGTELMHARSQSMNGIHHDSVIPEIRMEQPNGTVKGHAHSHSHLPPSLPVSRPVNNMPSTSAITTATEPPQTPTPPVLPQNMNGMVSLGAIIHRMTNEAFADLSNTSEM